MIWRFVTKQQGIKTSHISFSLFFPLRLGRAEIFNKPDQWFGFVFPLFFFFFSPRVNLDSVQSEANALLKRLNETKTKVSNSTEDMKGQYCKVLEVRDEAPQTIMSSESCRLCCGY